MSLHCFTTPSMLGRGRQMSPPVLRPLNRIRLTPPSPSAHIPLTFGEEPGEDFLNLSPTTRALSRNFRFEDYLLIPDGEKENERPDANVGGHIGASPALLEAAPIGKPFKPASERSTSLRDVRGGTNLSDPSPAVASQPAAVDLGSSVGFNAIASQPSCSIAPASIVTSGPTTAAPSTAIAPASIAPDASENGEQNYVFSMASGESLPFNDEFIATCHFRSFNPSRPTYSCVDILIRLGQTFGQGITKTELQQLFRKCGRCEHFIFADRRSCHGCYSRVLLVQDPSFDIVRCRRISLAEWVKKCNNFGLDCHYVSDDH
ncbi:hypothetical protein DFP72DRAFT_845321 [Ephemerocybe angulata]|uniref:Uncharacterized protein n=1 Tax=Ephemerocybe angulata TaxID=980116 RepID=A0A8H6I3Y2_9AGAR|nr:hypothetical protein DFP72DRAFT_845321 [Tulosesus angulatus]